MCFPQYGPEAYLPENFKATSCFDFFLLFFKIDLSILLYYSYNEPSFRWVLLCTKICASQPNDETPKDNQLIRTFLWLRKAEFLSSSYPCSCCKFFRLSLLLFIAFYRFSCHSIEIRTKLNQAKWTERLCLWSQSIKGRTREKLYWR